MCELCGTRAPGALQPQKREESHGHEGEEEEREKGREGEMTEKQHQRSSKEKENEDESKQQQYHHHQQQQHNKIILKEGEEGTGAGREGKKKKKRELETHRGFGPNAPKYKPYNKRREGGREGEAERGEEEKGAWKKLKSAAAAKSGRNNSSSNFSSSSAGEGRGGEGGGGDLNLSFSVSANTGRIHVEYQQPNQGGGGKEGGSTVCFNFCVEEFYSLMDGETLELTDTPFEVLGPCYQVQEGERGLLVPAAASSPAVAVLVACEELVDQWEELRGWEKRVLMGEGGREGGGRGRMELRLPLVKQLKDEMERRWK
eukprot:evm.model.NODE_12583_length_6258_cov_26.098434.1